MSLHQLAQTIQDRGRNGDSMLVHMTPAEVSSMQKLARAHGGSLTVNPDTGLPEANFLSRLLPTIIGAGVGIATANPMIGAAVGGGLGMAANKGSIQSGLMAGLGAYGLGSLGSGLMATGAESLATSPTAVAGALGVEGAATGAGSQAAMLAQQNAGFGAEGLESIRSAAGTAAGAAPTAAPSTFDQLQSGFKNTNFNADFLKKNMFPIGMAAAPLLLAGQSDKKKEEDEDQDGYIRPYTYQQTRNPGYTGAGTNYFNQTLTAQTPIKASEYGATYAAEGGVVGMADGGAPQDYRVAPMIPADANRYGPNIRAVAPEVAAYNQQLMQRANQQYNINPRPAAMQIPTTAPALGGVTPLPSAPDTKNEFVGAPGSVYAKILAEKKKKEDMANAAAEAAANQMYQPNQDVGGGYAAGGLMQAYAMGGDIGASYQSPDDMGAGDRVGAHASVNMGPQFPMQGMYQGYASGGISNLGSYSDGGRLLRGPGDGVSDDIPAQIGARQPARLADGEFVVPARIVSELGNGSTDAGAKRLYAMMDRVQNARKKSVGKNKVAVDSKAEKYLPA